MDISVIINNCVNIILPTVNLTLNVYLGVY